MQVTHFVNDHRGGLARYVERLIDAQQRAARPGIVPQVYGPRALRVSPQTSHLFYTPAESRWGLNQWKFAAMSPWVRHCGVRHFHNYTAGAIDVFTCHGLYTQNWLAKNSDSMPRLYQRAQFSALSALEARCLEQAKVVVFQSKENEEFVSDYFKLRRPGSFVKILQAVDTQQFFPVDEATRAEKRRSVFGQIRPDARWLLFVGHDFYGKGLLRIMAAFEKRRESHEAVAVLIFGYDPANKVQAENLARRLNFPVYFMADDELLKSAYQCSDYLMLDSVSEGGPMVLLEGMASGCVPIFTTCGGVRETILSGVNGLVAESADHIVQLALGTQEAQRSVLSKGAIETAARRDVATFERSYRDIYESIREK